VIEAELRKGWIPKKLNELGFVGRGKSRHRPRNDPKLYGGSYPFVQTADIMNSDLYITSFSQTYNEMGLAQSKLWNENTLCMTIAGANTAETALLSFKACFPDSVIGFIADPDKSDVRFVKYYLDTIKQQLKSVARGTTQHNLPLEKLLSFDIYTPPLPTQRKIAAILSAYDDLIENNTRRIAILEEMAQALYREWFVHFRYPGHEGVRMVESELGPVPEGWEVKPIGEVIETLGGGTPSKNRPEYWEGGDITWFIPSDLTSTGTMFISDSSNKINALGLKKSSARLFPPYSVMMTSRATIGVTAFNTKEACTNQGFITCVPNEQLPAFQVYFWIAENKEKIITVASGATFKEINKTTFRKLPIAIPDRHTHRRFVETVEPMCAQIENLIAKNVNLRQTRDLLLPRLISGELDVSRLEVDTEGLGA
jgi:type I restriction enzyme S subunit